MRRRQLIALSVAVAAGVSAVVAVVPGAAAAGGGEAAAAWPPAGGRGPCTVTKTTNVAVPMRDGTVLRADIYRPATTAKVPVILYRTQYNKEAAQIQPSRYQAPDWFASHCYLVVTQDIRGQYASGGTFVEFAHDQKDGYDSVEWAAKLPGTNGKVGMYGSSYVGATQWLAAESLPPHLVTIVPANTASDYYQGGTYEHGAFRLNFIEPWAMKDIVLSAMAHQGRTAVVRQLQTNAKDLARWMAYAPYDKFPPFHPGTSVAPYFFDWIRHNTDDAYWQRWNPKNYYNQLNVPVLNFEGWYDAFLAGGLQNFTGMVSSGKTAYARNNQRIVIGPWDHIGWGRPGSIEAPMLKALPANANSPINQLMLAWWDHFLKGKNNGIKPGPTVNYYEMGANVWRTAGGWPLPQTRFTPYYLSSDGHANTVFGDGQLSTSKPAGGQAPDRYTYDPTNPVPSVGGHSCCAAPTGSQGPYDRQSIDQRNDVLVFQTPPMTRDTQVTGPLTVRLYAASSAPDTDFTATVDDVQTNGTAMLLNDGIVRASYRSSLVHPTPITPGKVYEYTIQVWPTSDLVKAGDSIRLEISSSDYPQFDPNPSTGSWLGVSTRKQPAHQTILHDVTHPSALVLPIIPAGAGGSLSQQFPTTDR